jgi:hypothetical protein
MHQYTSSSILFSSNLLTSFINLVNLFLVSSTSVLFSSFINLVNLFLVINTSILKKYEKFLTLSSIL